MRVLEMDTKSPTLADAMNGSTRGLTKPQLVQILHDSNQNLAKAQAYLRQLTAENLYFKNKFTKIRNNYDIVLEKLKGMDPKTAVPYFKFLYDPRNFA